ncbi:MAG: methyltransferase domain-containing protein [Gammaproteobacteria bacterium]|nr:methyltransferase domain-containing protein [Gammaproteobacteria bacterium]
MILNEHFLFIHQPKTAGKSLTRFFLEAWERPIRGFISSGQSRELAEVMGEGVSLEVGTAHDNLIAAARFLEREGKSIHDLKAVIVGIRNPYDLAVSTYFFLRDRARYEPDRPRFRRAAAVDFETFWRTEPPTTPPERWLTLRGKPLANLRHIRFESIAEDLRALADEFDFRDATLPHLNPSKHRHYSEYMTPEVEEAIFTRFRYFFDTGLYPREPVRRRWRDTLRNPAAFLRPQQLTEPEDPEDITDHLEAQIASLPEDGRIHLPKGHFTISRTIKLPSHTALQGAGPDQTTLILAPNTNAHLFTNQDHNKGNSNIALIDLSLNGNTHHQSADETSRQSRALVLFQRVRGAKLTNVAASDGVQTGFHFARCNDVEINHLHCTSMRWHGVHSVGSSRVSVKDSTFRMIGAGRGYAAVRLNGGMGADIACDVQVCSVGVILTSKFQQLENVVVQAECAHCRHGIDLAGDTQNRLHNVLVQNSEVFDNELGIKVSNAANVFIHQSRVASSWDTGVLLEGRHGGKFVVVTDTRFEGNTKDVQEIHASGNNHFSGNSFRDGDGSVKEEAFTPKASDPGLRPRPADSYSGVCTVCGSVSEFEHNGGSVRESFRCEHCRSSLRYRGQAKAILEAFGDGEASIEALVKSREFAGLDIYEPGLVGPFREYFKELPGYRQSYYWPDLPAEAVKDGVPNHDLQKLDLPSDSVDLVVTSDIFEHVRRPFKAFKELHRVLRVGGRHVFTVPLQFPMRKRTVKRVDTSSEEDVFLLPPAYHSSGDGDKALVYNDFGADMLDRLEEMGFSTSISFIDRDKTLCGKNITFVSTKRSA